MFIFPNSSPSDGNSMRSATKVGTVAIPSSSLAACSGPLFKDPIHGSQAPSSAHATTLSKKAGPSFPTSNPASALCSPTPPAPPTPKAKTFASVLPLESAPASPSRKNLPSISALCTNTSPTVASQNQDHKTLVSMPSAQSSPPPTPSKYFRGDPCLPT